jgi:mRNA deadenylase 3'-5' endonuclease subunit Ccr4
MEALGDLGRTLVAYNPLQPEDDGGQGQLRVVSYNVYADIRCDTPEVAHTSSKSWKVRCTRLLTEVLSYRADVVLLQDADHFKDFWQPKLAESGNTPHRPALPLPHGPTPARTNTLFAPGYDSIFKQRTETKGRHTEGVIVAYNRDNLQLFKSVSLELNDACNLRSDISREVLYIYICVCVCACVCVCVYISL